MAPPRSAALVPALALSIMVLAGCSSSLSSIDRPHTMSPTPAGASVAEGSCAALDLSTADLVRITGLDLARAQADKTVKGGGSCIFASRYKNHDAVGLTGLVSTGESISTALANLYADDETKHGGCRWDSPGTAFHCNPLPGNPIPAYTVVIGGSRHLWDAEVWATTTAKLDAARAGLESALAGR